MALGRGAGALGESAPGAVTVEDESRRSPALGARPQPTPLPPPARALPAHPGLPGLGGGAGPGPASLLGISYPRICTCALEVSPLLECLEFLPYAWLFRNLLIFRF